ncbi:sugar-binding protein [Streptomyces spiroverticillatus]|uniref:Sugar-binding protein n=1 Tax=Streptomyces finlayi TaxID=67296 RepID=A0A919C9K9_9ACTN|nr:ABC transporter substrate-binding protein [Streptomyces finlayi]GHA07786.1 sugar-binding protein [Streptomyces spiroverticillatus]GHC91006.1 sugar-binding protein [Streptomyces finlayi]
MSPSRTLFTTRRRTALVALTTAALAASLTACGEGTDSAGGDSTVDYVSQWNPQDPEAQVINKAIAAFEKANPGIKVKATYAGRNNDAKILNQIKARNAPDIIEGGTMRLKQFKLEPLDDLYGMKIPGETKTVGEVIPDGLKTLNTAEGKAYAAPYEYVVGGLWYQEKQLASRDLKPPAQWPEFTAQAARFKADGQPLVQQDGSVAGYNFFWFVNLVARYGGPDAMAKAATDKTGETWKGEVYQKAADQVRALTSAGALNKGYEGTTFPAAQNAWAQGKGGYALNFSWMPKETDKVRAADAKIRYTPFPNVGGPGDDLVEADTTSWVVPQAAKHKDAAKKFLAHLYGKATMQGFSDTAKTLTPRTDVTPPALLADVTALLAKNPKVMPRLGNLERTAPADYITKVIDPVYGDFFKSVGKQTTPDFLDKLAKASKEFWATQR